MIPDELQKTFRSLPPSDARLVVLTGAGISAESGIPTFRGTDGYWTVGSKVYQPQEIATYAFFRKNPVEVWRWFLYRRGVCRRASPNPGHLALVSMEKSLGERFTLVTQNVDGLHLRAGSSPERTFQIHGNTDLMRCVMECSSEVDPLPDHCTLPDRQAPLPSAISDALKCPRCQSPTRPHVLWWDETYNERFYRDRSALEATLRADILLVVGTTGSTSLPVRMVEIARSMRRLIVDVDIEPGIFSKIAQAEGGFFLQGPSGSILPALASLLEGEAEFEHP